MYEYKVVELHTGMGGWGEKKFTEQLNKIAAEGWHLVWLTDAVALLYTVWERQKK